MERKGGDPFSIFPILVSITTADTTEKNYFEKRTVDKNGEQAQEKKKVDFSRTERRGAPTRKEEVDLLSWLCEQHRKYVLFLR